MARKVMDCRKYPSQSNCSLVISGEEEEVLRAGALHAVDVHGEKDTPELRAEMRKTLADEVPFTGTEPRREPPRATL